MLFDPAILLLLLIVVVVGIWIYRRRPTEHYGIDTSRRRQDKSARDRRRSSINDPKPPRGTAKTQAPTARAASATPWGDSTVRAPAPETDETGPEAEAAVSALEEALQTLEAPATSGTEAGAEQLQSALRVVRLAVIAFLLFWLLGLGIGVVANGAIFVSALIDGEFDVGTAIAAAVMGVVWVVLVRFLVKIIRNKSLTGLFAGSRAHAKILGIMEGRPLTPPRD